VSGFRADISQGSQPAGDIVIHPAVSCHYFPPNPPLTFSLTQHHCLLATTKLCICIVAGAHRHMCVNNLPRVVTWRWNSWESQSLPLNTRYHGFKSKSNTYCRAPQTYLL